MSQTTATQSSSIEARKLTRDDTLAAFGGDHLATDVFLKKYAVTRTDGTLEEYLPSQMWRRMAKAAASVEDNPDYWEEKFYNVLDEWKAVPQGSIMFALGNPYQRSSCSNCFVVPIHEDSLDGIFNAAKEMAKTYAYRGGVGIDISPLRPDGAVVSNAARTSTGAWSYMDFYSYITRLIGQHGRRGALMLTIEDSHPDVMNFITAKTDLTKVTGANISIKISDEFMRCLENDQPWTMEFSTSHETIRKQVPASEIWDLVIKCATETAEPGILFWDTILKESPADCYAEDGFRTICTNPSFRWNTKVVTDKGVMQIKDIAENTPVCRVRNILGEWHDAFAFKSGKNKRLYKISFSGGREAFCTAEHQWPVLNTSGNLINPQTGKIKKKKTEDLSRGDKIYLPSFSNPIDNDNCNLTKEDGFVLGWYLGDGYKTFHKRYESEQFGFVFGPEDQEYKIDNTILSYTNRYADSICNLTSDHGTSTLTYCTRDKKAVHRLLEIGCDEKGNGIPESVWTGNDKFIKGFVDGMFSSDGYVDARSNLANCQIKLVTKHDRLADDFVSLLMFYGIRATITKSDKSSTFPNEKYNDPERLYHRCDVCISGYNALLFAKTFSLTNLSKQERLNKILKSDASSYKKERMYQVVTSVEPTEMFEDVYDISVDDETHTFQMEQGISGNCSEIPLPAYDACTLLSMNLTKYVNDRFLDSAKFDYDRFADDVATAVRLLDNVKEIDFELMPLQEQRDVAAKGRRIGMGTNGLGDTLADLGIKYDTEEAIDFVDKLYEFFAKTVYGASAQLAEEKGPFPIFDPEKERDNPFLNRIGFAGVPRRNIACLTCAPTGSLSMLCQTSSGVEPVFRNAYIRRRKINHNEAADIPQDNQYEDGLGDLWEVYAVIHHNINNFTKEVLGVDLLSMDNHEDRKEAFEEIEDQLPDYFVESDTIDWEKRVRIQATMQKWVDHAISSCLAEGTASLTTSEGLLEIEEFARTPVAVGMFSDVPFKSESVTQSGKQSAIEQVYNNGTSLTYDILLEGGYEMITTPNHKLTVLDNNYNMVWKETQDIQVGDVVIGRKGLNIWRDNATRTPLHVLNMSDPFVYDRQTNSKDVNIPEYMSASLSRFLGYMCSDGSVTQNGITLTQIENNVCDDFETLIEELFGLTANRIPDKRSGSGLLNLQVNSRELSAWLRWLGLSDHDDISVPLVVRRSSAPMVKQFIKGLTLDGYVSESNLCVMTSVSNRILRQAQLLLLNLGIETNIVKSGNEGIREFPSGNSYPVKEAWSLVVSDCGEAARYLSSIGFAENRKTEEAIVRFKKTSRLKRRGTIPDFNLRSRFRNDILPNIKSANLYDMFHSITCSDKQDRFMNIETVAEMADMGLEIPGFLVDHTYTFRVVKSVKIGKERQTWDVSVPDGNSYIANGLINHNTCNLPKGTPVETVKKVYEAAYKAGCKGYTVYVDGCRDGVLVTEDDSNKNPSSIQKTHAPKRPKTLDADVYHVTKAGQSYFVMVGLLEGEPYEVFAGKNGFMDRKVKAAKISKVKRGHYKAELDNGEVVDNIAEHITDEEAAITRLMSLSLRHGADIKYCVNVLQRVPGDMNNFARVMSRAIKHYIPDGTVNSSMSEDGKTWIHEEGCLRCLETGETKCQ